MYGVFLSLAFSGTLVETLGEEKTRKKNNGLVPVESHLTLFHININLTLPTRPLPPRRHLDIWLHPWI